MEEKAINKDKDIFENDESIFTSKSVDEDTMSESKEVLTFLIPLESEEFKKEKEEFQWSPELEIFVKFWGLFVMKKPIPDEIWEYVYANKNKMPSAKFDQAISILAGAPIEQDEYVRQMVLAQVM